MQETTQHTILSISDAKIKSKSEDDISVELAHVRPLVGQAVEGAIYPPGTTGSYPAPFNAEQIDRITGQVARVANAAGTILVDDFVHGMPDFLLEEGLRHPEYGPIIAEMNPADQEKVVAAIAHDTVYRQILPKAGAFVTALAIMELPSELRSFAIQQLISFVVMYGGDQTMDRNDEPMMKAVGLLDQYGNPISSGESSEDGRVTARATFLDKAGLNIDRYAPEAERLLVRQHFYGNVLGNELRHRKLTDSYDETDLFLALNGRQLAEITTISAGFPTVTTSWYAIRRQQDPTLPELAELYDDPQILRLERLCNVVARLLDELGDWEMDAGKTAMGAFVINPFNQYHSQFAGAYYDLGEVSSDRRVGLDLAMKNFHKDKELYKGVTMKLLKAHARQFMGEFDESVTSMSVGPLRRGYELYVTLCKRVMEICFVNAIGDPALANVPSGQE